MWPYLGPIKTWDVLYTLSIISFFLVSRYYARGLRLPRWSWIMLGIIYLVGMTVGAIQSSMDPNQRHPQYSCDITYGTNNEFGFDYLRRSFDSEVVRFCGK